MSVRSICFVAERKGFFAREGIKLQSVLIEGGTDRMVAAIDKGKVDLAHSSTPYSDRGDAQRLAGGRDRRRGRQSGLHAGGAAGDQGLCRPQRQAIALSVAVDTISITTRKLLAKNGVQDGEFKVKQLVGTPVRYACLKSGECAGVPLGQPNDIAAVKGGFRRLGDTTEAVGNFQFQLIVAHRKWATANKDKLVPFVRAVGGCIPLHPRSEKPDETIKLMMEQTGSSEEIAQASWRSISSPIAG